MTFERSSGVLLHPTSLPGEFGIGDIGEQAYIFVDFLHDTKQKLWQILPLGPTGYGDSPYQCFSAFAGNTNLISPKKLLEKGLLEKEDLENIPLFSEKSVQFGEVIQFKNTLLRKAFTIFNKKKSGNIRENFKKYSIINSNWLDDYALFAALKDNFGGAMWIKWDKDISNRDEQAISKWTKKLKKEIEYYKFVQFLFNSQWMELKSYATSKGIKIIGDIPIFVSYDSADVWANRELFYLDDEGLPKGVAGVPGDCFNADGQLWGNPLYDWNKMKETGYKWWIETFKNMLNFVDIVRVDHFRGFEAYWEIPYGDKTAINGKWVKGPGENFFNSIKKELGDLPILAEDLGFITDEVIKLRDKMGFPGMNILLYAFGGDGGENRFLPHCHNKNSVVYTGNHDNDTTLGTFKSYPKEVQEYAKKYMHTTGNGKKIVWDFIRMAMASPANFSIIPMQDLMCLGSEARMNRPGTCSNNWVWRYKKDMLTEEIKEKLIELTTIYMR